MGMIYIPNERFFFKFYENDQKSISRKVELPHYCTGRANSTPNFTYLKNITSEFNLLSNC